MKARLLIIAAVGLLLAADKPPEPAAQKDRERLQGTWSLVSAKKDGKPLPADKVERITIVFEGDTFRFPGLAEDATSKEGTIKLDATKKPKQMDATSAEGDVMLGIYELEAGRYKVCFAPAGEARPSAFTSKPGSGDILQVWERKKTE